MLITRENEKKYNIDYKHYFRVFENDKILISGYLVMMTNSIDEFKSFMKEFL